MICESERACVHVAGNQLIFQTFLYFFEIVIFGFMSKTSTKKHIFSKAKLTILMKFSKYSSDFPILF